MIYILFILLLASCVQTNIKCADKVNPTSQTQVDKNDNNVNCSIDIK
jgi:hypothetical protein